MTDTDEEALEGEDMSNDTNSALRMLASFFAGIILTGIGAAMTYPRDLPTKADLVQMQVAIQQQVDSIKTQQNSQQVDIADLRVSVARITAKLGIDEEHRSH